jgi:hypothetical protein
VGGLARGGGGVGSTIVRRLVWKLAAHQVWVWIVIWHVEAAGVDWNMCLRVRVEIMGSQKCRIVGKSQPVIIVIDPIIFTCSRGTSCVAFSRTA